MNAPYSKIERILFAILFRITKLRIIFENHLSLSFRIRFHFRLFKRLVTVQSVSFRTFKRISKYILIEIYFFFPQFSYINVFQSALWLEKIHVYWIWIFHLLLKLSPSLYYRNDTVVPNYGNSRRETMLY